MCISCREGGVEEGWAWDQEKQEVLSLSAPCWARCCLQQEEGAEEVSPVVMHAAWEPYRPRSCVLASLVASPSCRGLSVSVL